MIDVIKANDTVRIVLKNAVTGSILRDETHNLITVPGEMHAVDRLYARTSVSGMDTDNTYCAVGTGSFATNYWIGSLNTEVSGIGNAGREKPDSISRSNQTVLVSTYFDTTAASGNLTECGLFVRGYDSGGSLQAVSATKNSGILSAYTTFNALTKDTSNTLTLDWEIQF